MVIKNHVQGMRQGICLKSCVQEKVDGPTNLYSMEVG